MNKCIGCGAILQNTDSSKEGYTLDLENKYCKRCFDITHYSKYTFIDKENKEYLKKIDYINKTNDLVILTIDLFNLFDLNSLNINNPIILVITKKDIIPRTIHENKILNKIETKLNIVEKLFVSSKNNYNLDTLINLINKYKTSKNVYFVGQTNAGKSSLINKLLKNYSEKEGTITVSSLPSTTLDFIENKVNEDLVLIDTPGLLDDGNIINVRNDILKKLVPTKEINPIIYQVKTSQTFLIEDFLRLDIKEENNIIFYISNKLNIERIYKETDKLSNLNKYTLEIKDNQDLVIKGLGFIKFKKGDTINLYLPKEVKYNIRNSII